MHLTFALAFVASLLLLLGLIIKVYRWHLFLSVFEDPKNADLAKALSVSQVINYIIPCHVGTIYRIYYAGNKLKNGIPLSIASIVIEHYIDLIVLSLICIYLIFIGHNVIGTAVFYVCMMASVFIVTLMSIKFTGKTKSIIMRTAGIFNDKIEMKILGFAWAFLELFKNLINGISRKKLFATTISMWGLYLSSYWCITESINTLGNKFRLRNIIDMFFGTSSIASATLQDFNNPNAFLLICLYILTPLLSIFLYSKFVNYKKEDTSRRSNTLIPHVNDEDALRFLELFFSGKQKQEYVQSFIEANREISIIQDYSAGSNALTLLCMDNQKTFFRKFAIGVEGEKLAAQIKWIQTYNSNISLPKIISEIKTDRYCSYDMEYKDTSIGFFNFIHSNPVFRSWEILSSVLKNLSSSLYTFKTKANQKIIGEYVDQKVIRNLEKIKKSEIIADLLKYDYIIVNGKKYRNLSHFESMFEKQHLMDVFANDIMCPIHGDLTIENIICDIMPSSEKPYYLIDPNPGNILESPYLDLAKLFQSLHGSYEFMMKCRSVKVNCNHVDYLMIRSSAYDTLYDKLKTYIVDQYGENALLSVYYHEVVHWLRLLPYKLDKIGERSIIFYTGLIIILNDIVNESR